MRTNAFPIISPLPLLRNLALPFRLFFCRVLFSSNNTKENLKRGETIDLRSAAGRCAGPGLGIGDRSAIRRKRDSPAVGLDPQYARYSLTQDTASPCWCYPKPCRVPQTRKEKHALVQSASSIQTTWPPANHGNRRRHRRGQGRLRMGNNLLAAVVGPSLPPLSHILFWPCRPLLFPHEFWRGLAKRFFRPRV